MAMADAAHQTKSAYVKKADGTVLTVWELLDKSDGVRSAFEELHRVLLEADSEDVG